MLSSVKAPSAKFIYYARRGDKKFPVRQDAEEMIERIRSDAEAFEESRTEEDPLRALPAICARKCIAAFLRVLSLTTSIHI